MGKTSFGSGRKISARDLILFDLDGTLADTIPALRRAFGEFLDSVGIEQSAEKFSDYNGTTIFGVCETLKLRHRLPASSANLYSSYNEILDRHYAGIFPFEGAIELLCDLKKAAYRIGLVTSSQKSRALSFLENNGLRSSFDLVIAANEQTKGKPDPELYLQALAAAGIQPDRAIAVEDSSNGIAAARAAGLLTIEFLPGLPFAPNRARSMQELGSLLLKGYSHAALTSLVVRALPLPAMPFGAKLENTVNTTWQTECSRNPQLTNDKIFCFSASDRNELTGSFLEYKYYLAKKRGEADLSRLPIIPVGVTGLVRSVDAILFARRSSLVTDYRECWELIPSGGIDESSLRAGSTVVSAEAQLRVELSEELTTIAGPNTIFTPVAMVFDFIEQILDLAFEIRPAQSLEEIVSSWKPNSEYSELFLVKREQITAFISDQAPNIVPTSLALLETLGWLNA